MGGAPARTSGPWLPPTCIVRGSLFPGPWKKSDPALVILALWSEFTRVSFVACEMEAGKAHVGDLERALDKCNNEVHAEQCGFWAWTGQDPKGVSGRRNQLLTTRVL